MSKAQTAANKRYNLKAYDRIEEVHRIYVAVDATDEVIKEAIEAQIAKQSA